MKNNPLVYENLIKMNSDECKEKAKLTKRDRYNAGCYDDMLIVRGQKISNTNKQIFANGGTIGIPITSERGKEMASKNNADAQCPHCGKVGQYRAMRRWHYDNCKVNSNIILAA